MADTAERNYFQAGKLGLCMVARFSLAVIWIQTAHWRSAECESVRVAAVLHVMLRQTEGVP